MIEHMDLNLLMPESVFLQALRVLFLSIPPLGLLYALWAPLTVSQQFMEAPYVEFVLAFAWQLLATWVFHEFSIPKWPSALSKEEPYSPRTPRTPRTPQH